MEYIDTFEDLKKFWTKSKSVAIRNIIRDSALDLLSFKNGFSDPDNFLTKPRVQFLYIHHIFRDEEANFNSLLENLAKHHTFISHSEAIQKVLTSDIDRPYISFSSDDGLKSNLKAAEILERYGAKCCFFINPNSIGLDTISKSASFCNTRLNMPPVEFLNWNDVHSLLKRGHEIGAHTMNHEDVSKLTLNEFEGNLIECKDTISSKCGDVLHFAYTYGGIGNYNKNAHELVFKTGYESSSSGIRGCHIKGDRILSKKELLIRRDHIIGAWKLNHIMHFLKRSSEKSIFENNFLPSNLL